MSTIPRHRNWQAQTQAFSNSKQETLRRCKRCTSLSLPYYLQSHLQFRTVAHLPITPVPKVTPTQSHNRGWASHLKSQPPVFWVQSALAQQPVPARTTPLGKQRHENEMQDELQGLSRATALPGSPGALAGPGTAACVTLVGSPGPAGAEH